MNNYRKFSTDLNITKTEALEDGQAVFEGYFIKYNSKAPYGKSCFEMIDSNALENTLNNDIRCLFNHNTDLVLGRTGNGTLKLENRSDGLYGICTVNLNDSDAKNAYERVKRGDISGCSFGAFINKEEFDEENNTFIIRDLDLIEVSVCSFPFYEQTTMEARDTFLNNREVERLNLEFLKRRGKMLWH